MTTTTPEPLAEQTLRSALAVRTRPDPAGAASASMAFGWRAMLKVKHVPEQLFDVTVFPVLFLLMFTYLFGGALAGSPREYLQGLLPGILVMTVVMITMYTGLTLNVDIERGVFDRFRSLPVWQPAILVGALLADAVRYTLASLVMLALGLALGFRPAGGALGVLAGVALLLAFCFGMSWTWTLLGLVMRSEKSVMGVSMMVLFPLTFLSNILVDPATMPRLLQRFVEVNPITHLVTAVRDLMHGSVDPGRILLVLAISAAFVVVFGPLTMRRFRNLP